MPGGQPQLGRHVGERDSLGKAGFDHVEDRGEQPLFRCTQVAAEVGGQPGDLDEQQRQVGEGRVVVAVAACPELGVERDAARTPGRSLLGRNP